MAGPRERAPDGIVSNANPSPLGHASIHHHRRWVRQFPLPGRPTLLHDPDDYCPLRLLDTRIDLATDPSPPTTNEKNQCSLVAQRHHLRQTMAPAETGQAIHSITMCWPLRWLLWRCALLCWQINAEHGPTSTWIGQGRRHWGLQLQEVGTCQTIRLAPAILGHDREDGSRGLFPPPIKL